MEEPSGNPLFSFSTSSFQNPIDDHICDSEFELNPTISINQNLTESSKSSANSGPKAKEHIQDAKQRSDFPAQPQRATNVIQNPQLAAQNISCFSGSSFRLNEKVAKTDNETAQNANSAAKFVLNLSADSDSDEGQLEIVVEKSSTADFEYSTPKSPPKTPEPTKSPTEQFFLNHETFDEETSDQICLTDNFDNLFDYGTDSGNKIAQRFFKVVLH